MNITHDQEANELFQAQTHLYNYLFKYISSMSLKCAIQLDIPGIIHNQGKPITLPELVRSLQVDPTKTSCIYRLMRLLVQSGFFAITKVPNSGEGEQEEEEEEEEEAYVLTPSSKLLVKDSATCLLPFATLLLCQDFSDPFHFLGDWFQGKEITPFEKAHGVSFWGYTERNPEFNQMFNSAMASDSQMMNLIIRNCKPIFEGLDSFVDAGGGNGSLARIISEAFPLMKCTVLELPQVIANLESTQNLSYIGGDMLQHIPSADAVILKLVLHSWNDENCLKILKNCREAISSKGKGGKVIIIDVVVNDKKEDYEVTETKLLFDMLMMTVVTGRERKEKEWERLFLDAGFSHYKITPLLGLRSLIEVYP